MQDWAPDDKLYGYVYPALVYADMGDMDAALDAIHALMEDHAGQADAIMLAATGFRLLGREPAAAALMAEYRDSVAFSGTADNDCPDGWQESLFGFVAGELSFDRLAEIAPVGTSARRILGEAHYHAGAMALSAGDRTRAKDHFRRAYHAFDGSMGYTFHAEVLLRKLENDDTWPPWVVNEGDAQSRVEPSSRVHAATAHVE